MQRCRACEAGLSNCLRPTSTRARGCSMRGEKRTRRAPGLRIALAHVISRFRNFQTVQRVSGNDSGGFAGLRRVAAVASPPTKRCAPLAASPAEANAHSGVPAPLPHKILLACSHASDLTIDVAPEMATGTVRGEGLHDAYLRPARRVPRSWRLHGVACEDDHRLRDGKVLQNDITNGDTPAAGDLTLPS